jgi:hypothetical protein
MNELQELTGIPDVVRGCPLTIPVLPELILPALSCYLRILLAKDNLVNRRLISRLLVKMGHTVAIAENGRVAMQLLSEREFDLVAMDMQMPIMDGLEVHRTDSRRRESIRTPHADRGDDRERLRRGPRKMPPGGNGQLRCQASQ